MKPFRTSVRAIPRSGCASRPERRGSRAGLLSDAGRACEGRRPVISQHEQRTHEEDRRRAVLFCRPRPVCDEYRRHSRPRRRDRGKACTVSKKRPLHRSAPPGPPQAARNRQRDREWQVCSRRRGNAAPLSDRRQGRRPFRTWPPDARRGWQGYG